MIMSNKQKGRFTATRETDISPTSGPLQVTSASGLHGSKSKLFVDGNHPYVSREPVVLRQVQITGEMNMKRYNQGPPDFPVNHLAEKVPIHYRSNRRNVTPGSELGGSDVQPGEEIHLSPKAQKAPAFLPGDRVIFAESPSAPGIPVVYRTQEERTSNPDRLNLDRRKLHVCPILEGEEQLRLLNYQHNMITKIQHLSSLKRLIFLDLYDNQIEDISGLSSLKSLRVLMLGKNRIAKIENLDNLLKLDVLDLHGNQIPLIENLCHLTELRVLNLAGNKLEYVESLTGMDSLAELNLRRNNIRNVSDVDTLPSLQRLFLSFNKITCVEDIACLGESTSLSEISLDGNPIANEQYYKQIVLRHMQQLKQLDMKRISEEERRMALVMARKDEEKKREMNKAAVMKEKRRLALNNAKRQWEVMQGSMMNRTGKLVKMPELYANHLGSIPNSDLMSPLAFQEPEDNVELESVGRWIKQHSNEKPNSRGGSRPSSAHSSVADSPTTIESQKMERERPRTGNSVKKTENKQTKETVIFGQNEARMGSDLNNLAELEGDTLMLVGNQSLDALDRNWGVQAAGSVNTVLFKFIDFDAIVKHLPKLRARFPSVQTLRFSATNIRSLQQLNALANVRRLDNLILDLEGNPITKFTLWRMYVLFRLAHFALKKINDVEVTAADIVNAEKLFGSISHITTSQLPQSRLLSLLGETRRKQLLAMNEDKSKKLLEGKLDKVQGEFVGRAGLSYSSEVSANKQQDINNKKNFAKNYISELTKEAIFTDRKRNELMKLWPQIFNEMVCNAVMDMLDTQTYMKKCMEDLEKS